MLLHSLSEVCTPDDVGISNHQLINYGIVNPVICIVIHLTTSTSLIVNALAMTLSTLLFIPSVPKNLNRHPIWSSSSIMMNQKGWKGQLKRIKKSLNGLYELGLTGLYAWVNEGQARLVQRSIMDRRYEKLRWNPHVNRILAQKGF